MMNPQTLARVTEPFSSQEELESFLVTYPPLFILAPGFERLGMGHSKNSWILNPHPCHPGRCRAVPGTCPHPIPGCGAGMGRASPVGTLRGPRAQVQPGVLHRWAAPRCWWGPCTSSMHRSCCQTSSQHRTTPPPPTRTWRSRTCKVAPGPWEPPEPPGAPRAPPRLSWLVSLSGCPCTPPRIQRGGEPPQVEV